MGAFLDPHPRGNGDFEMAVDGCDIQLGAGREAQLFAQIAARAGRTFWLNPEPRLYWNYGDSVISAYEKHCTAFECWRTDQLEEFVKALTRPEAA